VPVITDAGFADLLPIYRSPDRAIQCPRTIPGDRPRPNYTSCVIDGFACPRIRDLPGGQAGVVEQGGGRLAECMERHPFVARALAER